MRPIHTATCLILRWICASLLVCASFASARAADLVHDISFAPTSTDIRTRLDELFTDYRIVTIDLAQTTHTVQTTGQVTLPLIGTAYDLSLQSHTLRTPQFQRTRTDFVTETVEPAAPVLTYRGVVTGQPGSEVRLTIAPNLLFGFIQTADIWLFLEPLYKFIPNAPPEQLVVYRADRIRGNPACTGPLPAPSAVQTLTVAAETDGEFFALHGSHNQDVVEGLFNLMDGYYQRTAGPALQLTFQHVWTDAATDPYSATDHTTLLDEFSTEWGTARSHITHDLAYLFTGNTLETAPLAQQVCADLVQRDGNLAYALAQDGAIATSTLASTLIAAGLAASTGTDSSGTATALPKAGTLIVTEPDGVNDKVAEGRDYATYELGNPWDMSDAADVMTSESGNINNEVLPAPGGIYKGSATTNDPGFWLVYPGLVNTVNLANGHKFPINTSIYRYLTLRVRYTGTTQSQVLQAFFFKTNPFPVAGDFGFSDFVAIPANTWTIVTIDLYTQATMSPTLWQNLGTVRGLRIDPTNNPGVTFEVDWARLTAAPNTTAAQKTVQWTASGLGGSTFSVQVLDGISTPFTLVSGLASGTTSYNADFSIFPPGTYQVRVNASNGMSDTSGSLTVNQAPILNFLEPDAAGDTANDYATAVTGNAWGPFDAGDIAGTSNITNQSFAGGIHTSVNTTGDPSIRLNTTQLIDTSRYRMLSYRIEVSGTRNIGTGGVTRVFWGNALNNTLTASRDIILEEGLNTYAIGDLADIQIEPGVASNWLSNDYQFFRFDPHEYSEARTTQLHFLRLAPYDTATPSFNLTWVDSDGDDDATIALYYDTDKIPFNGNETLVVNGLSENATNSYTWNASGVASGVYQILAQISDGRNTTQRYATGPLQVQGANNDYLYNISSRSQVGTGGNIMIAGLIIEGSGPKTVLLRGRGPSINIPSGKLANPYLDLVNAGGNVVAANNDWGNAANSAAIQATGLAPTNAQEAAILITLNPGAYTTRLSGVNNTTGIGIVEAFDVDGGGTASLGNISTRSQVGTSSDILIAGFIINGTTPKTVLLRGRGPSINIPSGKLANPYMDLVNSSGTVIATNDNWGNAANSAAIQATGLAPTNAQEAAILITLNPGAYTTRLSGINNTTGIGIVEVFDRD